jgi:putative YphP/YqiW family bacilliredoxin
MQASRLHPKGDPFVPYPEFFVAPMREELTELGIEELRTPDQVDEALTRKGTTLLVVNSVCGCAAGRARPAIAEAVKHPVKPDHMTTVFAGADVEATSRARDYLVGYPPSSPSVALLRDGQLVWMLERRQIESQSMEAIVRDLTTAFDQHCAKEMADKA